MVIPAETRPTVTPAATRPRVTTAATDDTTTPEEPAGETFGDLAVPCGPGESTSESDTGVTADTIKIGTIDDRGFPDAPGLNHEMSDAVDAMVVYCNGLGGINGRQIELVAYDAAIFNAGQVILDACDSGQFMLVGNGMSFDDLGEEARLGCGLAQIPAWNVSAAAAHSPLTATPVPNPADQLPSAIAKQLADVFPDEIQSTGILYANFSATIQTKDKVVAAYPDHGWNFVNEQSYNISGEDDWTPFVNQLKDAGAEALYFTGSCLPNYLALMQTAAVNEYSPMAHADANFYEAACASANADGVLDNTYVRMVFIPFEERDVVKAVDDYINIVEANNGDTSLLGMQSTSAFWLWATAAAACGDDLTRDCVMSEVATQTEWTGGGLHVPTNPAANDAPDCGLIVKFEGTSYVRFTPDEPGTFDCDPSYRQEIQTQAVIDAQLDENRISQLYSVGG